MRAARCQVRFSFNLRALRGCRLVDLSNSNRTSICWCFSSVSLTGRLAVYLNVLRTPGWDRVDSVDAPAALLAGPASSVYSNACALRLQDSAHEPC